MISLFVHYRTLIKKSSTRVYLLQNLKEKKKKERNRMKIPVALILFKQLLTGVILYNIKKVVIFPKNLQTYNIALYKLLMPSREVL